MIRRDYILRMIEEFAQALTRIRVRKADGRWDDAAKELDAEFEKLVGSGAGAVAKFSETELLACLLKEGPTHLVRDKTLMVGTLLKEAGDLATAENDEERGRTSYLKSLHLLLTVLGRGEVGEMPGFVPQIEMLRSALSPRPLPPETAAMLMEHYERSGAFAQAENTLFAMIESQPQNKAVLEFGRAFYHRLLSKSDAVLAAGDLSRDELEQGISDLESAGAQE